MTKERMNQIEKEAKRVLNKHAQLIQNNGQSIDVVSLATGLGFKVGEVEFNDDTDGIILVDTHAHELMGKETDKLILVSKDRTRAFKRFIVAHELGHYFLGQSVCDDGRVLVASRDSRHGRNAEENEYDFFAACLLMPREAFIEIASNLKSIGLSKELISKCLAEIFNVPIESAVRRMYEVGME